MKDPARSPRRRSRAAKATDASTEIAPDASDRRRAPPAPRASEGTGNDAPDAQSTLENASNELWTIGELADELGLTTRAIRFYEAKGLLAPERRGIARSYSRRDRARILLILRGKNLGFTLDDIREYLELYDADPAHLAQRKLLKIKVEAHIASLERKRADIEHTLSELHEIRAEVDARLGAGQSDG